MGCSGVGRGRIRRRGLGVQVWWIRYWDGPVDHAGPGIVGVFELGFGLYGGYGMEEQLADIGENGGVAGRDTVLGEGGEDFAEDVIDVGGGVEMAGERGGQFGAETARFDDLHLFAGVEGAETAGTEMDQHAATAAIGKGKAAEIRLC